MSLENLWESLEFDLHISVDTLVGLTQSFLYNLKENLITNDIEAELNINRLPNLCTLGVRGFPLVHFETLWSKNAILGYFWTKILESEWHIEVAMIDCVTANYIRLQR